jgi:hypothetical protein
MAEPPRCISSELHDRKPNTEGGVLSAENLDKSQIHDLITHYFGCLQFCEREVYFSAMDASTQDQIRRELRRILRLRGFIRQTNKKPNQRCLVENVEESLAHWRSDSRKAISNHWDISQTLRQGRREGCPKPCQVTHDLVTMSAENREATKSPYDPNKDARAKLMQYRATSGSANYERFPISEKAKPKQNPNAESNDSNGQNSTEVRNNSIKEKRSELWEGTFPCQKIMVHDILEQTNSEDPNMNFWKCNSSESKPESSQPESEMLRYLHFPSNNMKVYPVSMVFVFAVGRVC